MTPHAKKTQFFIGALLTTNTFALAACGGGGAVGPLANPIPTLGPVATPTPLAQQSVTVELSSSSATIANIPAVLGLSATVTLPAIPNAPAGATATVKFSARSTGAISSGSLKRDVTPIYAMYLVEIYYSFAYSGSFPANQIVIHSADYNSASQWFLDTWSNGKPNCSPLYAGVIDPQTLDVTFPSAPSVAPAITASQTGFEYSVIGAVQPYTVDPVCTVPTPATVTPTPIATATPVASAMPSPTPTATPSPVVTISPAPTPTSAPTSTASPTTAPTATPTALPTATPSPGPTFGPLSALPDPVGVTINNVQANNGSVTVSQMYNGVPYTGPFSVNVNTCNMLVTISQPVDSITSSPWYPSALFTVYPAAGTTGNCDLLINGGGGHTLDLPVRITNY